MSGSERIDALWDFDNPAVSEERFQQALDGASGDEALEIRTQIARTLGLRRRFDEARTVLDAVRTELAYARSLVRVRLDLEWGRVLNSGGDPIGSRPYFEAAVALAHDLGETFYKVDAAHMLGIVCPPEEALEWNHKAIQIAEGATDERARGWLGSLLNNTAWTIHDQGRPEEALELFEKALAFRLERGNPKTIRIARWCVGRCLRSLGRIDEALRMQRDLMSEGDEAGYGSEEIGECLLALGRVDEAKPHFARASELLSKDEWLVANEPARIERLRALS